MDTYLYIYICMYLEINKSPPPPPPSSSNINININITTKHNLTQTCAVTFTLLYSPVRSGPFRWFVLRFVGSFVLAV